MSRITRIGHLLAAASAVAIFFSAQAEESAAPCFERVRATGAVGTVAAEIVEVAIQPEASAGLTVSPRDGLLEVRYPMVFNNVAEGWNWNPLANPAVEDYYAWKYLPLASVVEERGEYDGEDKIGEVEHRRIVWRYDYFLAFANLYDFYPRSTDDDAGFFALVPAARVGHIGLRAVARLIEPWTRESSTFWKATYRKPVDFSLKKRYLMAELLEIRFVDQESGAVLAVLRPQSQRQ